MTKQGKKSASRLNALTGIVHLFTLKTLMVSQSVIFSFTCSLRRFFIPYNREREKTRDIDEKVKYRGEREKEKERYELMQLYAHTHIHTEKRGRNTSTMRTFIHPIALSFFYHDHTISFINFNL